jgi:hypothetical protein
VNIGVMAVHLVLTGLGMWWGWRMASVALWTGTAPKWRRKSGVGRREHKRRVKYRQQFWRLSVVAFWGGVGYAISYVLLTVGPFNIR